MLQNWNTIEMALKQNKQPVSVLLKSNIYYTDLITTKTGELPHPLKAANGSM